MVRQVRRQTGNALSVPCRGIESVTSVTTLNSLLIIKFQSVTNRSVVTDRCVKNMIFINVVTDVTVG